MSRLNEAFANDVRAALDARRTVNAWPLLSLLFLLLLAGGVWASFAEIEEVTIGEGRVIPSSKLQVIQSLEGGLVAALFVSEGDVVEAGQPLVQLDDTAFAATLGELRNRLAALELKSLRLRAEALGHEPQFQALGRPLGRPLGHPLGHPLQQAPTTDTLGQKDPLGQAAALTSQRSVLSERALYDARKASLERELAVIDQQLAQRRIDKKELETRRASLEQSHVFLAEQVASARKLSAAGAYPRLELLQLEREASEQDLALAIAIATIPKAQAAIDEAIAQRDSTILAFRAAAHEDLTTVLSDMTVLKESLKSAEDRVQRTILRAPVRGIVNNLAIATIGAVVPPGESLAELVPLDDSLLIEAQIRPQDVAFLSPGQPARVRVSAYDFTIYGDLAGKVERISADTLSGADGQTFYRAIIRTEKNYVQNEAGALPILPGMIVSAAISTGQKTVMTYLLKPILTARSEALRER